MTWRPDRGADLGDREKRYGKEDNMYIGIGTLILIILILILVF